MIIHQYHSDPVMNIDGHAYPFNCTLNSVLDISKRNSSSVNSVNICCTLGGSDFTSSSPLTNVGILCTYKRGVAMSITIG